MQGFSLTVHGMPFQPHLSRKNSSRSFPLWSAVGPDGRLRQPAQKQQENAGLSKE